MKLIFTMQERTRITVVGSGYVGMSLSVLLAQHNEVKVLDIDPKHVEKIKNMNSTVADEDIQLFLTEKDLSLDAVLDKQEAYKDADFIIIATPTNYNKDTNKFDTSIVDEVVEDALRFNDHA